MEDCFCFTVKTLVRYKIELAEKVAIIRNTFATVRYNFLIRKSLCKVLRIFNCLSPFLLTTLHVRSASSVFVCVCVCVCVCVICSNEMECYLHLYYIYSFTRHFYPKRLKSEKGYASIYYYLLKAICTTSQRRYNLWYKFTVNICPIINNQHILNVSCTYDS